ncbi:MAG: MOSC domain-containing protein [Acidobacteriia bacterium]|nr:MOSC domain-containing protein [Terriglobia bacterium]
MPSVLHLFRAIKRGLPMQEEEAIRAVAEFGFEGCAHARPGGGQRQVLLMDRETLDALHLTPGIVRENITTEGLDVNGLEIGQRLRIGEALLEVSGPCTPCGLMDKLRPGLRREIRGRRGTLCRVITGGGIRRGDAIEKLP